MNPAALNCWRCSASLVDLLLPLSRLAKCKACNADLHVCRMCKFYNTAVSNSCSEPVAEKVVNKQDKNFCGYFMPAPNAAPLPATAVNVAAKNQLDALFGLNADTLGEAPASTAEEESRRKLQELFGLKDEK